MMIQSCFVSVEMKPAKSLQRIPLITIFLKKNTLLYVMNDEIRSCCWKLFSLGISYLYHLETSVPLGLFSHGRFIAEKTVL